MPIALDMQLGSELELNVPFDFPTPVWRADFRVRYKSSTFEKPILSTDGITVSSSSWLSFLSFTDNSGGDGVIVRESATLTQTIRTTNATRDLIDGNFHTLSVVCDGTETSFYLDGNLKSTEQVAYYPESIGCIGKNESMAPQNTFDMEFVRVYGSTDTSSLIHAWEVSASDTSNTGSMPVIIDTVAGNNATARAEYPTDGSAFISYVAANIPPSASNQTFNTDNTDITGDTIGTLAATDSDGDTLSYSTSSTNININSSTAVMTWAIDPSAQTYTESVDVSDGTDTTTVTVTINVADATAVTVSTTDTDVTYGQAIPVTAANLTDADTATASDESGNTITLAITGSGTSYTVTVPAMDSAIDALIPENWTITVGNGVDSDSFVLPFATPASHDAVTVTTLAGTLTVDDWAYGVAVAPAAGDFAYFPTTSGLTWSADGTVTIDTDVFTGGVTITGYTVDITDMKMTEVAKTYEAESGTNTAPTVTIQNTSITVSHGTAWNDSLLGTVTVTDDNDSGLGYTVDRSGYNATTAGTYTITVTSAADSGGLTGTATASVTVEAEVTNSAPTVSIQNTSISVEHGTTWNDSLLGTITVTDDNDSGLGYTVDSTGYNGNAAGSYTVTVTSNTDSGGLTGSATATVTVQEAPQAPVLEPGLYVSAKVGQGVTKALGYSSGVPTSWAITGGDDAANYSIDNNGRLSRNSPNESDGIETVIVTATNAVGTSDAMTVRIEYIAEVLTKRKKQKRVIRNYYYYGDRFRG
jgi:hypothetical protein